jgi:hypothetical protein
MPYGYSKGSFTFDSGEESMAAHVLNNAASTAYTALSSADKIKVIKLAESEVINNMPAGPYRAAIISNLASARAALGG